MWEAGGSNPSRCGSSSVGVEESTINDPTGGATPPTISGPVAHRKERFATNEEAGGFDSPQALHDTINAGMKKIPALDGVRGIAILMVMMCHLVSGANVIPHRFSALRFAMYFGWSGVDLFFVLSGFLITGILIDTRDSPNRASRFYARRILRIFPLYYFALAVAIIAVPLVGQQWLLDLYPTVRGWLSYLFYVQNWWMPHMEPTHGLVGQFWSLAVEEQFYLVWPMVVWSTPRRYTWAVCLIGMVAAFVLRKHLMRVVDHPWSPIILMGTATRMDSLLSGALCAVIVRDYRRWLKLVPYVATCGICGMLYIMIAKGEAYSRDAYTQTYGYTFLALAYSGLVVVASEARGTSLVSRLLSVRPLRLMGKYSYGIYVYHGIVIALATRWFQNRSWFGRELAPSVLFCLFAGSVSVLIAAISYELFEKYFIRMKPCYEVSVRRPMDRAQPSEGWNSGSSPDGSTILQGDISQG